MARGKTVRTDRARQSFLQVLGKQCNVSAACRAANIGRSAAYVWKNDDPQFSADWDEAEQIAADRLEEVAWKRAVQDESDRMLEILLKAHRPEKYTDRQRVEHAGGVTLNVSSEDASL